MQYGLIGEHLGHSYSCEIHAMIADYRYELQELRPEELGPWLEKREFRGINVTIPYKQAVIPYLDSLSETAARIGAVNTIVQRVGKLCGYNTDFAGMRALARRIPLTPEGKKVLILGTGGTSKTARAVMESLGAGEILHVSRRAGAGTVTYEQAAAEHRDARILVNTTPVGMFPQEDAAPVDLAAFPALEGVLDAVYHPLRTDLVQSAADRGISAAGGLYMLCAQAVWASAVFRGAEPDEALTDRVFRRIRQEKENLVLIGMPTSGKTTVGRLLAARTNRPFLDTDELLAARLGCSCAEYLTRCGEAAFRAEERAVIAAVSRESGSVIATGGGSVLSEENVRALRHNGMLVFLDRALENLTAAADRPLSSDPARLAQLYAVRQPIYQAAADIRVQADVPPEAVADRVIKEWEA